MSESRVKLAKLTGDELAADVETIVKDAPAVTNAPATTPGQLDGAAPVLTEAVRALIIMAGCDVVFAGNHWLLRKKNITVDEERSYAFATLANRRKIRLQTGVPLVATFEDWRAALNDLTGNLPQP